MPASTVAAVLAATAPLATAAVEFALMEHIGDGMYGDDNAAHVWMSQEIPEHRGSEFDAFIALDNFSTTRDVTLTRLQVMAVTNTYSFDDLTFRVSVFSSLDAAASSVIGDVYSAEFEQPTASVGGFWLDFDISADIGPGDYWISVIATSETNQFWIYPSYLGDRTAFVVRVPDGLATAILAQGGPADLAYNLYAIPTPGTAAALALAGLAAARRRR